MTPSYKQSTATLRCIKGYTATEPGYAVCSDDGEWIIQYPECEGRCLHGFRYCILHKSNLNCYRDLSLLSCIKFFCGYLDCHLCAYFNQLQLGWLMSQGLHMQFLLVKLNTHLVVELNY